MRGGLRILARNNFAGRANPTRIFAGLTRGGPMRGGLARFATPSENSVSCCTSLNAENYSQLLQAFKETHEEANRLALLNNCLKGMNNWLENRVKTLEEELEN